MYNMTCLLRVPSSFENDSVLLLLQKIRTIELDGKTIKLQIVSMEFTISTDNCDILTIHLFWGAKIALLAN